VVARLPTQFGSQFGRIDGIPEVMAGAVGDVVVGVGGLANQGQDQFDNRFVVFLAVRAEMRYVSPMRPSSRIVSTAEEWSSA
jgi:hypothetical protein